MTDDDKMQPDMSVDEIVKEVAKQPSLFDMLKNAGFDPLKMFAVSKNTEDKN